MECHRDHGSPRTGGIGEPLRTPLFRRIWSASLLSNLGLMIQAVGAAWSMIQLTTDASMVALVQTALMLPIMLISIPAGAIADMYDRRKVGLFALSVSLAGATALSVVTALGLITPWGLLGFCFLIGTGMALFGPAWQASVSEQVPAHTLPQAIALNSISYNIARSFGPAIGGIIVAAAGAVAAFTANALLYVPLLIVLLLWRRIQLPSRLPPERLHRAISSGFRYVIHSPSIRIVLWRTLATGVAGGSVSALMPLVARDLLHGNAETYGLILGTFGIGAVAGALNIGRLRQSLSGEQVVSISALVMAAAIAVEAFSKSVLLTGIVLIAAGAAWMISVTVFNIAIQLSAPRWVAGRTLAAYQASICGGIAFGSWLWGTIAQSHGASVALLASAGLMVLTPLLGRWLPMPAASDGDKEAIDMGAPDVALALTARSGPIVVEIEYCVKPDEARAFYGVMQKVQLTRHRNGAYNWSIARDISEPALWTERFHCPTWLDYLRLRSRHTGDEIEIQQAAEHFHSGDAPLRVRRRLERPFGSVRWKDEAPDAGQTEVLPITAT
ncbi:MFS transporter (plasmid) [Sphingomonas paeninsulae]|uniref:MFS transporter n=1 Tax=Sphingomonas paeninsulae TaxID=2319844 RepID=A0A494THF6_SPHPE|nr:MFS transporter [Sphingomonas paeninsulae]AYJ85276.1 MFS transporter [Sphingomonas paeninsulae]